MSKLNKVREKIVRDLEKEYKVSFGVNPRMKVSTYLKRKGLPNMAKALQYLYNILNK